MVVRWIPKKSLKWASWVTKSTAIVIPSGIEVLGNARLLLSFVGSDQLLDPPENFKRDIMGPILQDCPQVKNAIHWKDLRIQYISMLELHKNYGGM